MQASLASKELSAQMPRKIGLLLLQDNYIFELR